MAKAAAGKAGAQKIKAGGPNKMNPGKKVAQQKAGVTQNTNPSASNRGKYAK